MIVEGLHKLLCQKLMAIQKNASICYNQSMFNNLKTSIIALCILVILSLSSFAFLTHHSMPSSSDVGNSSCKTVCYTESTSTLAITLPEKLNTLLVLVLPLLCLAIIHTGGKLFARLRFEHLHNLGPPLYKRFEIYRT